MAAQFESSKVLKVYVLFVPGVTDTIAGLLLAENDWPFESVPFHGPFPVRAMLNEELLPAQISAEPLNEAVGRLSIDIWALLPFAAGHTPLVATTR